LFGNIECRCNDQPGRNQAYLTTVQIQAKTRKFLCNINCFLEYYDALFWRRKLLLFGINFATKNLQQVPFHNP